MTITNKIAKVLDTIRVGESVSWELLKLDMYPEGVKYDTFKSSIYRAKKLVPKKKFTFDSVEYVKLHKDIGRDQLIFRLHEKAKNSKVLSYKVKGVELGKEIKVSKEKIIKRVA